MDCMHFHKFGRISVRQEFIRHKANDANDHDIQEEKLPTN